MHASLKPAADNRPSRAGTIRIVAHGTAMLRLLSFYTIGDIVLTLVGEMLKTRLVWYLRVTDLIDLLLIAPLYLVCLVLFHEQFLARSAAPALRRSFLVLALLFFYGHAMHLTANAINTFSTEIRDYRATLPADTYALIYFLDETLSHWLVFLARYGLFACLLELEVRHQPADIAQSPWPAIAVGVLYGVWQAIVFTEGQKVLLAAALVVGLGALWLWRWHRSGAGWPAFVRTGPVTAFVGALLPSMLLGLGLYVLIVGGFTEPSRLGL